MNIDETANYQLVSIEGDGFTAKTQFTQQAANQKIQNPSMPGMKVELTRMVGKGTGDVTFDLGKLMPQAGSMNYHSDLSMAMNVGGKRQPMTVNMDMTMGIESK